MTHRVFIDGAAGTTGLEIRDRLQERAEFALLVLDDAQRKDDSARREALHAADIAILCLPDEAAKEAVKMAEGSGTRIIDASSAHRVTPGWVYGFPEVTGHGAVADAALVSNPGCYSTGFIALVAPLVHAGLLPADWPYICNAVSGYSGGGNTLIARFGADRDIAWRGYALQLGHKHVPEMQSRCGLAQPPLFTPAVIPAHRGMVVDVPLPLSALPGQPQAAALHAALATFFKDSAIVKVAPLGEVPAEMLLLKSAAPWDGLALHVCASADGTQARLIAHLDNLGKGASGAAIQNLNIMCGLPETTGLRL